MPRRHHHPFRTFLLVAIAGIASLAVASAVVDVERYRITLEPVQEERGVAGFVSSVLQRLQLRAVGVISPDPGTRFRVVAVAYSSTVDQTDLTPCITASGERVRKGIVATNFLPLGTRIRIGEETYIVADRMNAKYNGQQIIDVWHPTTVEAREFGRQNLEIEILGEEEEPAPTPPVEEEKPTGVLVNVRTNLGETWGRVRRFLTLRAIPQERDCLMEE